MLSDRFFLRSMAKKKTKICKRDNTSLPNNVDGSERQVYLNFQTVLQILNLKHFFFYSVCMVING